MKTAEDFIIEKVGEYWWICGKHRPEFIAAAEEYAEQQVKNLTMNSVSNRRELLIAFCNHGGIQSLVPTKAETIEQLVNDFESNL